jgi:hypothetical protein
MKKPLVDELLDLKLHDIIFVWMKQLFVDEHSGHETA